MQEMLRDTGDCFSKIEAALRRIERAASRLKAEAALLRVERALSDAPLVPDAEPVAAPARHDRVALEHDPEKWEPVFGKDHAQSKARAQL